MNILSKSNLGRLRHYSGYIAELVVCLFLFFTGHIILERRYRARNGEIDIIALKDNVLVFIEVKKRKKFSNLYHPLESDQKCRIVNASYTWLSSHEYYRKFDIRYDFIVVKRFYTLKHFKNYF